MEESAKINRMARSNNRRRDILSSAVSEQLAPVVTRGQTTSCHVHASFGNVSTLRKLGHIAGAGTDDRGEWLPIDLSL